MEAAGHCKGPVVAQGSGGPAPRSTAAWEAAVAPRGGDQDGHPCMRKESLGPVSSLVRTSGFRITSEAANFSGILLHVHLLKV